MSPLNSSKPSPDIFVSLLFVSVASLIAGISLLALELRNYGWELAP